MRAFDLVVWDWDGTIVDSTAAITQAILRSAADLGLPVPSESSARWVIGLGLFDALRAAVPSLPREQIPAFIERYRVHYLRAEKELQVFEGIPALLERLDAAGSLLAVATGKSRVGLERALDQTGLRCRFIDTRCADEGAPKPDPWMLQDLAQTLGVAPDRMVMIGDTTHDVGMARAAGAASVAVLYGAHDEATLRASEPDALIQSVPELSLWLEARGALESVS